MVNIDRAALKVIAGTATGQKQSSTGTGELNIPKLPYDFPVTGHIMLVLSCYVIQTVQSHSHMRL